MSFLLNRYNFVFLAVLTADIQYTAPNIAATSGGDCAGDLFDVTQLSGFKFGSLLPFE